MVNLLGDKHAEWQALEGLGAVAFNGNQIDKAVQYFKMALAVLSTTESNPAAQERLMAKINDATTPKVQTPTFSPQTNVPYEVSINSLE